MLLRMQRTCEEGCEALETTAAAGSALGLLWHAPGRALFKPVQSGCVVWE